MLIGHEGHDEVVGTMGEAPARMVLVEDEADVAALDLPADAQVAYLTQTTLSVDETEGIIAALRRKYPHVVGPAKDDICYATQNRQEAVKDLVPRGRRGAGAGQPEQLQQQAAGRDRPSSGGKPAHLIDTAAELRGRAGSAGATRCW